jgi:hypothetical protein
MIHFKKTGTRFSLPNLGITIKSALLTNPYFPSTIGSAFIFIYFIIGLTPVLMKSEKEYFPFFSFKLYSKIPNGFIKYDLLFNAGSDQEHYLLYKNVCLNKLERKCFDHWLAGAVIEYNQSGILNLKPYEYLFDDVQTVSLVKISGDVMEMVNNTKYTLEVIEVIK